MSAQVLVIDDSMMVRQQVSRALTAAGFSVVEASDGADALEKLASRPGTRLVVCDVHLSRIVIALRGEAPHVHVDSRHRLAVLPLYVEPPRVRSVSPAMAVVRREERTGVGIEHFDRFILARADYKLAFPAVGHRCDPVGMELRLPEG